MPQAVWISTEPTKQTLTMMRGDSAEFKFTHDFGLTANVDEVRFTVRVEPDGDTVIALTLTDNASQIDVSVTDECTITILPADTDGKPHGRHWYDLELTHTNGTVTTFHYGFFQLIPDMANDYGGSVLPAPQSDVEMLVQWALTEAWAGTFTRDGDDVITTAAVTWPDGSGGTFTTTTKNTTFLCVDAFTVTHTTSGLTVTQTAVTRNSNGAVTVRPLPTVA